VISFRYHLVTIAAVFLALAVGLLGGGAFVQPALQDQLERQTDQLKADNGDLRQQNDELQARIDGLTAFSESVLPYLTDGSLVGTQVVVVTQAGVEDEVLAQTLDSLTTAGATVLTTVSASELLVSEDPAVRGQLAQILGQPSAPPEDLPAIAASELAGRLSTPTPQPAEGDVLTELLSAGFLAPVGAPPQGSTLEQIGAPGQVVVVLSGGRGEEDPALAPEAFAVPLVEALGGLGQPAAAGESLLSDHAFVALLRASGVDGRMTVDDLDQPMGGAALVMGLDRLLSTGEGGDYGVKDGADPLPPPP